jgi:hypothetical protein
MLARELDDAVRRLDPAHRRRHVRFTCGLDERELDHRFEVAAGEVVTDPRGRLSEPGHGEPTKISSGQRLSDPRDTDVDLGCHE